MLPDSFQHVDGAEEAIRTRKKHVDEMLAHPPKLFISRKKNLPLQVIELNARPGEGDQAAAVDIAVSRQSSMAASEKSTFGWAKPPVFTAAPEQQAMNRADTRETTSIAGARQSQRHVHVVPVALRRIRSELLVVELEEEEEYVGEELAGNPDKRFQVLPRAWSIAY
jgi:hypothetical protein